MTSTEKVIFRVGPSAEALRRFDFREGRIVELNNQAKHYVANLWNGYRTHLIFDYVDDAAPRALLPPLLEETALRVGDRVLQTRRSIDLASERGTGALAPHFLILGAQKAGTTSMYEYVAQHPLVIRGRRRESHFLDWRWPLRDGDGDGDGDALRRAWHDSFFDATTHAAHPSLVAGDSTPSFLLASHVAIPRLRRMDMTPPMVVMLRDPVARAASHHAMITDPRATPDQRRSRGTAWLGISAREVALGELRGLVYSGALKRRSATDGDPTLTEPYDFDQAAFERSLARLPNSHGAHSMLARGLYAAQLVPWLAAFPRDRFAFVRCEDMATPDGAAREVQRVLDHIGLREHPLTNAQHFNSRPHDALDSDFHAQLRAFYAPFNQALYDLLHWPTGRHW